MSINSIRRWNDRVVSRRCRLARVKLDHNQQVGQRRLNQLSCFKQTNNEIPHHYILYPTLFTLGIRYLSTLKNPQPLRTNSVWNIWVVNDWTCLSTTKFQSSKYDEVEFLSLNWFVSCYLWLQTAIVYIQEIKESRRQQFRLKQMNNSMEINQLEYISLDSI